MGLHIHVHSGERRRRVRTGGPIHASSLSPLASVIVTLICVIVSAVTLLFYFDKATDNSTDNYVSTTGIVSDYAEKWDSEGYYLYAIIVEYSVSGNRYYVQSNSYSSHPKSIGSSVKVRYNPLIPSEAVLESEEKSILPLIVGVAFGLVSILMVFNTIKVSRREK